MVALPGQKPYNFTREGGEPVTENTTYASIDFKSFYASVECVERGLDPLTARLVVADQSRTDKTICLAVSPALKALGIPGRPRLFEVVEKAREYKARTGRELTYTVAPPRMRLYMEYSARIYEKVYLKYIAPEDIHIYSVDEVFMDLTRYLKLYRTTAHALVRRILKDVLAESGITATAGIGTNLYLTKVAMDIVAKHQMADADGVRIAELDEMRYRELLWDHRPLTDFWWVGPGISRRLARHGCYTMGDVARRSLQNEEELYREFGIDAELLIDHAWGYEPCTMADIKAYQPSAHSMSVGQVLPCPYDFDKGRLIVQEMADQLSLDLVAKGLVTDSVTLCVGYDREGADQGGPQVLDWYGRPTPPPTHGSLPITDAGGARLFTASSKKLIAAILDIYDAIVAPTLTIRRFYVIFDHVLPKDQAVAREQRQMDLFTDPAVLERERSELDRECRIQQAMLDIRRRFGKNALLRGISYEEGATARVRNTQVGGHRAGEETAS